MFLVNLKRILRGGFLSFWRNGLVSLASVLAIFVSLFVVGVLMIASAFFAGTTDQIKDKVDISVSFKTDVGEVDVLAMKKSLEMLPEVKATEYISQEQELKDFRERHKDNALLIQSLQEVGNPFGARLNIKAKEPSQYESIARFLNNQDNTFSAGRLMIDQVSYKKDIVDRLNRLMAVAGRIGLVLATVFICLAVFVTFNTISLAIYTSREEISVMRLVGAGNSYVKGPFIVEGFIAGTIAAFLAIIALYPCVLWIKNLTFNIFGGINLVTYYLQNFAIIFLTLLASGIALGVLSGYLAVRRYAKV